MTQRKKKSLTTSEETKDQDMAEKGMLHHHVLSRLEMDDPTATPS